MEQIKKYQKLHEVNPLNPMNPYSTYLKNAMKQLLPSGYVKIAIENGHRNSEFSH